MASAVAGTAASGPVREDGKAAIREVNQTRIFAQTLKDLLTVARLQVTWHDPSVEAATEKFAEKLAGYDCVVLVGDHASYDLTAIQQQAKQLIDARDHQFQNLKTQTAKEKDWNVSAVYTGVVPIVYKAQRTLLDSLIESTFWSFITITPLLMFIARSFSAGMVAMLPNVLPVFVIFGVMGWMGIQVDIGSMMTASIALGVAVDDTIHYLTWFREELDKSGSRHHAILEAYRRCATPTFQAAIISGLGLSIFAFSTFTPTQRFGYLMLSILMMGVAAELIFFPALLAGPLGRVFKPTKRPGDQGDGRLTPDVASVGEGHQPGVPGDAVSAGQLGIKATGRVEAERHDAAHGTQPAEAHLGVRDGQLKSRSQI
jgi:predicted RND superfamily exporter protein